MLNPTLIEQLAQERRRELVERVEADARVRALRARRPRRPAPMGAAAVAALVPARLARRWGAGGRSRRGTGPMSSSEAEPVHGAHTGSPAAGASRVGPPRPAGVVGAVDEAGRDAA
jgi:hypothetical protein